MLRRAIRGAAIAEERALSCRHRHGGAQEAPSAPRYVPALVPFLDMRRKRWANVAAAARVPLSGPDASTSGFECSCRQAEAGMGIDRGHGPTWSLDYGQGWGIVTDAQVRQRFEANQRDVFYLTGSMQLIVLRALVGERAFEEATVTIASVYILDRGRHPYSPWNWPSPVTVHDDRGNRR